MALQYSIETFEILIKKLFYNVDCRLDVELIPFLFFKIYFPFQGKHLTGTEINLPLSRYLITSVKSKPYAKIDLPGVKNLVMVSL